MNLQLERPFVEAMVGEFPRLAPLMDELRFGNKVTMSLHRLSGAELGFLGKLYRDAGPVMRTRAAQLVTLQRALNGQGTRFGPDDDLEMLMPAIARYLTTDALRGGLFTQLPVHPYIFMFHLELHHYLWVHVDDLAPYEYQPALKQKLILPPEQTDLIDILTAEVYSEIIQRPLYRVHSGQLGLNVAAMETALKDVLTRAQRWGAVMLIDEADVYIRRRDDNIAVLSVKLHLNSFLHIIRYAH